MNIIQKIDAVRTAMDLKNDNGTKPRESTIPNAGLGLFATIEFKKNDFVDFYTGEIIFDTNKLPTDTMYLFYNEKGKFYIDGKNGNSIKYINHQEAGRCNCAYKYYKLPDLNIYYPIVVCLKDVAVGQELFCDYGKYYNFN